ncbi:MAG: CopG family transcriptional regulator [Oscillospiraceae bacterium]|jgi:predicted DNA-binding protein|nr:CopG family transcriptional regulator [Oscillospiraceae bacterium]
MEKKFIVNPKKSPYGKTTVVSARLPDRLVRQLDKVAQTTGRTRNELLVMCVEFSLENLEIGEQEE